MKEFKVNKYLALRLENRKTYIYIKGKRYVQCVRIELDLPKKDLEKINEIESLDGLGNVSSEPLLNNRVYQEKLETKEVEHSISPEEEFWGHCSNLQYWYESNYDSEILFYNIAFPLLKKLSRPEVGDPLAKKVFKEEICKKFKSSDPPVVIFLSTGGYLNYLEKDEVEALLSHMEFKDELVHHKFFRLAMMKIAMDTSSINAIKIISKYYPKILNNDNENVLLHYEKIYNIIEKMMVRLNLTIYSIINLLFHDRDNMEKDNLKFYLILRNEINGKIINLLKSCKQIEPDQIVKLLGETKNNVYHNLKKLDKYKLIKTEYIDGHVKCRINPDKNQLINNVFNEISNHKRKVLH